MSHYSIGMAYGKRSRVELFFAPVQTTFEWCRGLFRYFIESLVGELRVSMESTVSPVEMRADRSTQTLRELTLPLHSVEPP